MFKIIFEMVRTWLQVVPPIISLDNVGGDNCRPIASSRRGMAWTARFPGPFSDFASFF
jgi:hypothetical protein